MKPGWVWLRQTWAFPAAQSGQSPQAQTNGTVTRWPTRNRRTRGPTESITSSYNLVKSNAGSVIGFAIVVTVLNLITCGLAIGITQIAIAYAYKTLNGEPVSA